jgi:hypothetical protein
VTASHAALFAVKTDDGTIAACGRDLPRIVAPHLAEGTSIHEAPVGAKCGELIASAEAAGGAR